MSNVAPMHKPKPVDPLLTAERTLWSGRALFAVIGILDDDLHTAQGKWTKTLGETMSKMNEPLRLECDEEKLSGKRAKEMLLVARAKRRERDDQEEQKRDDLAARKRRIKGFEEALAECLAIELDAGEQLNLLDGQAGVAGMGWASKATVESVYSALRLLDERGTKLNPVLVELMAELGTAGIQAIELNLSAGEAIENETPVPAANDDEPAASDGGDEASGSSSASAPAPAPAPVPF